MDGVPTKQIFSLRKVFGLRKNFGSRIFSNLGRWQVTGGMLQVAGGRKQVEYGPQIWRPNDPQLMVGVGGGKL